MLRPAERRDTHWVSSELDLVREAFEGWNEGVREVRVDWVHPDCELVTRFGSFRGQPYRGYAGVAEWIRDINENFEDWRLEADDFHEEGGRVAVLGRVHLRGRGSGVAFPQEMGWLFDFRDGRIVRMETFTDSKEALVRLKSSASQPAK